jgi:predicted NUDIX family NTP pyrophosphohydrolase
MVLNASSKVYIVVVRGEWACIDAMLGLSGEPVGPYWRGIGVKVWEMPHGLEVEGHQVWVLPRRLEVEGQNVCILPDRWGGLEDEKS